MMKRIPKSHDSRIWTASRLGGKYVPVIANPNETKISKLPKWIRIMLALTIIFGLPILIFLIWLIVLIRG